MNIPESWVVLEEVDSTQRFAAGLLRSGRSADVVYAHHQNAGKGRFDRIWLSDPSESLTFSIIFREAADHPRPWLVGMSCAIAAAKECGCQVQWPNDLVFAGNKLGGVLVELLPVGNSEKRVPVVGIGINVKQHRMPYAIEPFATSLALIGVEREPIELAVQIAEAARRFIPGDWSEIEEAWAELDQTPGKKFKLSGGEIATAISVGVQGALLAEVDGQTREVFAADALFGLP